jgi:hypothetical protein
MHRIFTGMACWTSALLVGEFALGIVTAHVNPSLKQTLFSYHFIGGVFVAMFVCLLHVMVMFHFIGSGKEIKEAVVVLGGDADVVKRVRRFKAVVFPFATFAPIFTGAAEILGGGAHTGALPGWVHWSVGLFAILFNLFAFPIEYNALKMNLELLDEVDLKIKREISPALWGESEP